MRATECHVQLRAPHLFCQRTLPGLQAAGNTCLQGGPERERRMSPPLNLLHRHLIITKTGAFGRRLIQQKRRVFALIRTGADKNNLPVSAGKLHLGRGGQGSDMCRSNSGPVIDHMLLLSV